jgi:hypothetical protein
MDILTENTVEDYELTAYLFTQENQQSETPHGPAKPVGTTDPSPSTSVQSTISTLKKENNKQVQGGKRSKKLQEFNATVRLKQTTDTSVLVDNDSSTATMEDTDQ